MENPCCFNLYRYWWMFSSQGYFMSISQRMILLLKAKFQAQVL
jgi:hypothetical protein